MSIAELTRATQADETLWKEGGFAEDRFELVADEAEARGGAIVSLARWRRERPQLLALNAPIGLLIQPGENWDDVVADLDRFAVVAVAMPKYADGRAFSIGRRLRLRDRYRGELRAIGAFIIDQVPMLRRVGFDSFTITDPILRRQLGEGAWPEVPTFLQPMDDVGEVPAGTRPWTRRRSAEDAA